MEEEYEIEYVEDDVDGLDGVEEDEEEESWDDEGGEAGGEKARHQYCRGWPWVLHIVPSPFTEILAENLQQSKWGKLLY